MNAVIDASALGSLLLGDGSHALAETAAKLIGTATIHAPAHWPVEVMNLLLRAERSQRIDAQSCRSLWHEANLLIGASAIRDPEVGDALLSLALIHRISARDAAYVDLALRLEAQLVTGDKAMADAGRALGVALAFDPA